MQDNMMYADICIMPFYEEGWDDGGGVGGEGGGGDEGEVIRIEIEEVVVVDMEVEEVFEIEEVERGGGYAIFVSIGLHPKF